MPSAMKKESRERKRIPFNGRFQLIVSASAWLNRSYTCITPKTLST